jgi:ATP-dependent protease HslVU (ClpYQ) peptidase subunit
MTVIAWDGHTLAADKRMGFGCEFTTVTKIYKVNGELIGWAGESALGRAMIAWYRDGAEPKDFPAAQRDISRVGSLIVIRKNGAIWHFAAEPYPCEVEDKTYTIGSGSAFAAAALYLGRCARGAVEVACALDMNCGNGIDTLELE